MTLEYHDKVYTKKCPCGNVITITGIATTDEDGHHTTNYRVDGSLTGLDKFCRVVCTCWKVYNASAAIGRYHAKERTAHQETPAPEYPKVQTEAGTQYSFDVAPETQLALF